MKIILHIVIIYLVVLLIVYLFQERFIFIPEKLHREYNFALSAEAQEVTLKTSDQVDINAIFYKNKNNQKVIIYFHGNAGSLAGWKDVAAELLTLGCNVLIIDYRGYGKSGGRLSEQGFYKDGEAAYQYVKQQGYSDKDILFYGRSLGTGVAIELASHHQVDGLILETPYVDFVSLAMKTHWFFWPKYLLRYRFDNINKVKKLMMPVLILHGDQDEFIPSSHSEQLSKAIPHLYQFVLIPNGNHNNLNMYPEHAQAIKNFLASVK